jgi:hypothetical protein
MHMLSYSSVHLLDLWDFGMSRSRLEFRRSFRRPGHEGTEEFAELWEQMANASSGPQKERLGEELRLGQVPCGYPGHPQVELKLCTSFYVFLGPWH